MKFLMTLTVFAAMIANVGVASAQSLTTFSFESTDGMETSGSDAFNNQSNGSITVGGVTLFATATAPEFDASGNLTGDTTAANTTVDIDTGIGVDNPTIDDAGFFTASGDLDDSESTFISGTGETLSISFDQDVVINAFNFFGVGNNETVTVTAAGQPFNLGSSADSDNNEDPFGAGFVLTAGQTVNFGDVSDSNGDIARYSLETFSVTPTAVVPEPSTLALLGLGGLVMAGRRRRRI